MVVLGKRSLVGVNLLTTEREFEATSPHDHTPLFDRLQGFYQCAILDDAVFFLEQRPDKKFALVRVVFGEWKQCEVAVFEDDLPLGGPVSAGNAVIFYSKSTIYCWRDGLEQFRFDASVQPALRNSEVYSGYCDLTHGDLALPFAGYKSTALFQGLEAGRAAVFTLRLAAYAAHPVPLEPDPLCIDGSYSFTPNGEIVVAAGDLVTLYYGSPSSHFNSTRREGLRSDRIPFKQGDVVGYFVVTPAGVNSLVLNSEDREVSLNLGGVSDLLVPLHVELLPGQIALLYRTTQSSMGVALWRI